MGKIRKSSFLKVKEKALTELFLAYIGTKPQTYIQVKFSNIHEHTPNPYCDFENTAVIIYMIKSINAF